MFFLWMFVRSLIVYVYQINIIFLRTTNERRLVKEGKPYLIDKYKGKETISLISTYQGMRLINNNKKFVMLILRPKIGSGLQ